MNTSLKDRASELFQKHNVSAPDQEFWFSRLENATEVSAEAIVGMFEEFPAHIGWFKGMQEKKEAAFASEDEKAWEKIVEEEKEYLTSIAA